MKRKFLTEWKDFLTKSDINEGVGENSNKFSNLQMYVGQLNDLIASGDFAVRENDIKLGNELQDFSDRIRVLTAELTELKNRLD
tara:strand:- start:714 stop:965 length:252 start_codon:yes stop_codon:yes gene_type:complete